MIWFHRRAAAALVSATLVLAACGAPRVVNETWDDGHAKRQGQLVSGRQEGEWSYWYDNGQPQAKGSWKGDKQFGEWTWWWPNGQVQSHGQYLEGGTRAGHWRQFSDNGQLASEGDYDRNRQDGLWRYWYPSGKPYAEGLFDFGVKSGLWRTWNADGSMKSQGAYFLGLKVGPWRDGATGESTDLGAPRGFVASSLKVGDKPVAWAMSRAGKDEAAAAHLLDFPLRGVDGACALMQADGSMRFASNVGGRGVAAGWYADGGLACAGRTIDGAKDGRWRYWHENGQLAADLLYDRGRVLEAASWSPDGTAGGDAGGDRLGELVDRVDGLCDRVALADGAHGDGALGAALPERVADNDKAGVQQQRTRKIEATPAAAPPPAGALAEKSSSDRLQVDATERAESLSGPDAGAPFGGEGKPSRPAPKPVAAETVPRITAPAAAAPAQLDFTAPDPTAPALSPMQVLPAFWTKAEEGKAASFVARYSTGSVSEANDDPYAADTTVKSQRPDLVDKPLAQTRFLGADGSVIDVGSYQKPVVVVLLRGFGGQVCLYCAAQTAALCKRIDDFHKAGAEVVVLYPGPAESAPAFIQAVKSLSKEPPPMPVALDVSLLLVRALGVEDNLARPTSLVLDRTGKVRFAYVGKTIADRPSADDLLREVRRIVQ